MGSWWFGLWNIVGAVWNMVLDVAQFWRDVSVVLQSYPGYLVCVERSEPEMAKTKRSTRHDITRGFQSDLELMSGLQKLLSWWHSKSPRDRLFHTLAHAQSYEEWEEAAFELDELQCKDIWYGIRLF